MEKTAQEGVVVRAVTRITPWNSVEPRDFERRFARIELARHDRALARLFMPWQAASCFGSRAKTRQRVANERRLEGRDYYSRTRITHLVPVADSATV